MQKEGVFTYVRHYLGDEAFYLGFKIFRRQRIFYCRNTSTKTCNGRGLWRRFKLVFQPVVLNSGHPILAFSYEYEDSTNTQLVYVEQLQNLETTPLYKLNMDVALYFKDSVLTYT